MEPLTDTKDLAVAKYWSQVVYKGLQDQSKLIERSKHLVDQMDDDTYNSCRDSAYKKVFQAIQEGSIHPLRTLKTCEKGVLVRDVKEKLSLFFNLF